MTHALVSPRHDRVTGPIRVAGPRIGDVLSGALHLAYDDHAETPDEFARLLARIDAGERRSQ